MMTRIGPAVSRRRPPTGVTIRKSRWVRRLLIGWALCAPGQAGAAEPPRPQPDTPPRAACLAAARQAEAAHALPRGLLVAIALSESGLHAHALNIGGRAHFPDRLDDAQRLLARAAPRDSVMAGCVQVNARVHARGHDWPLEPHRAADWAARLLRRHHDGSPDWTAALRRWHGGGRASSQRVVCRVHAKLSVVAPGSTALDPSGCSAPAATRVARSGRVLLEVAEAGNR